MRVNGIVFCLNNLTKLRHIIAKPSAFNLKANYFVHHSYRTISTSFQSKVQSFFFYFFELKFLILTLTKNFLFFILFNSIACETYIQ